MIDFGVTIPPHVESYNPFVLFGKLSSLTYEAARNSVKHKSNVDLLRLTELKFI